MLRWLVLTLVCYFSFLSAQQRSVCYLWWRWAIARLRYVTWRYLIIYSKSLLDCALLSSVYYFLSNASVFLVSLNTISVMANTMSTITLLYRYNVRKCTANVSEGEPSCRSNWPIGEHRPRTRLTLTNTAHKSQSLADLSLLLDRVSGTTCTCPLTWFWTFSLASSVGRRRRTCLLKTVALVTVVLRIVCS